MADTPKVYVICDQNCKFESLTKEQILTAILQAVNEGTIGNIDTGFITTIKTVNNVGLKFFYGTQAAYNELSNADREGLYPIITDDATIEGINRAIDGLLNGEYTVKNAERVSVIVNTGKDEILDEDLKVMLSYKSGTQTPLIDNDFKYSPQIKTLFVENVEGNSKTATTAKKLVNGEAVFGRELLYKEPSAKAREITYTESAWVASKDLSNSFLVVEVAEYAGDIYQNTYIGKYRTTPFNSRVSKYSNVSFNSKHFLKVGGRIDNGNLINDHVFAFWVDGKTLKYQHIYGASTANTASHFYITKIYEEY